MNDHDTTGGAVEPSAGASPTDDTMGDIAKSLPGAGRLHDGSGNQTTEVEDNDDSDDGDDVRPTSAAPLP